MLTVRDVEAGDRVDSSSVYEEVAKPSGTTRSGASASGMNSPSSAQVESRPAAALEGMVQIPAGEFLMGSPPGEGYEEERPQHRVQVDAFYMDTHEVTVGQYKDFIRDAGHRAFSRWVARYSPTDDCPIVDVSWDDATAYARWTGKRLPTEAEWEYACRAGSTGKYCFGNDEGRLGEYAWYYPNAGGQTHPVGQKRPNAWGLYDMHGNVTEWCSDWFDKDYYRKSPSSNPRGPANGRYRVLRGGSWYRNADLTRAAFRYHATSAAPRENNGFRCARDLN